MDDRTTNRAPAWLTWLRAGLALAGFSALAVLQFRDAWRAPTGRWIGVDGDPALQAWFLGWTPHAIASGESPFFTTHLNHPDGVNLMWNTLMPLPGFVLAPITAVFGPVAAFNVLMTSGPALGAWTGSLAARRWTDGRWIPALVGGLLFGFSPYAMAHAFGHANLTFLPFIPLLLLLVDDLLVRQPRPAWQTGALLGLVAAAQALVTEELLASSALVAGLGLLVLVVRFRSQVRERVRHAAIGLAVGLGVAFGVLAWPLLVQFTGDQRIRGGHIQPLGVYATDLLELVRPTGLQQLSPAWADEAALRFSPVGLEWNGYLGLPLLALVAVAVWRLRRSGAVQVLTLVAAGTAILSFGRELRIDGHETGLPLPFRLVEELPVFGHMLPNRMMLFVYLLLGVVVAAFLASLHRRGEPWPLAAGYGAAAIALISLVPVQNHPTTDGSVPAFFEDEAALHRLDGQVVLVAPFTEGPAHVRPMLWQAVADYRFEMPSGYFIAPGPDGHHPQYGPLPSATGAALGPIQRGEGQPELDEATEAALRAEWRRWEVTTVVLGPSAGADELERLLTEVLGERPQRHGGVLVWWEPEALDRGLEQKS